MLKKKAPLKKKDPLKSTPAARRYAAVVMRKGTNYSDRSPHKDWSCFVDAKKEDAVKRALAAARSWAQRYGEYDILVGQLTESVNIPVQFELVKL
jgi:hypothetical protein